MIRLEVTSMPQGHLGLLLFMTEHHVFDQDLLELAPRASTRNLAYCIPPHPSLASPKRDRQDSAKAASKAATHIRKLQLPHIVILPHAEACWSSWMLASWLLQDSPRLCILSTAAYLVEQIHSFANLWNIQRGVRVSAARLDNPILSP